MDAESRRRGRMLLQKGDGQMAFVSNCVEFHLSKIHHISRKNNVSPINWKAEQTSDLCAM